MFKNLISTNWLSVGLFIPTLFFASTSFAERAFDDCEKALKSEDFLDDFDKYEKAIREAQIYTIDQLSERKYKIVMGLFEKRDLMMAEFEVVPEDEGPDFQSPHNAIAVYLFDQLLGARMNVAPAVPYMIKNKFGVLALKPLTKPGKPTRSKDVSKTLVYNTRLFDFLIYKSRRPFADFVFTPDKKLMLVNNADAFDYEVTTKKRKMTVRDHADLRLAWDHATMGLKERILQLSKEAVTDELSDHLGPLQIEQLWERVEYLRAAIKRPSAIAR